MVPSSGYIVPTKQPHFYRAEEGGVSARVAGAFVSQRGVKCAELSTLNAPNTASQYGDLFTPLKAGGGEYVCEMFVTSFHIQLSE